MNEPTDNSRSNTDDNSEAPSPPSARRPLENTWQPEMPPSPTKKTVWDLAKTALDPDACKKVLSQIMSRQETQLREQKPAELKPLTPIENFKMASPCSTAWEQMQGTSRVRFCFSCKQQIYDFSNIDKAEADDLIFQREGKHAKLLYKRQDGRFLTRDCPVGAKRKLILVTATAAVVLCLASLLLLLMSSPPVASPPAVTSTPVVVPAPTRRLTRKSTTLPPGSASRPVQNMGPPPGAMPAGVQNMGPPPGAMPAGVQNMGPPPGVMPESGWHN